MKGNECGGTRLEVTKSTTIGQLKNMEIFDRGRRKCLPDAFTLGDYETGKKLEDDITVASIAPNYSNGDRCLNFYSCSYYIQKEDHIHPQYKTFINNNFPYNCYWGDVICCELGERRRGRSVPMVLPGDIVKY